MPRRSERGFTMVELVMVVAIIGVLATLAGPNVMTPLKVWVTKSNMATLGRTLQAARVSKFTGQQTLINITGSTCSFCDAGMGAGLNLKTWNPPASYIRAWQKLGFQKPPKDPFGAYYALDENDGEFGTGDCRWDTIWSAGPDNVWGGAGAGDDRYGDDIVYRLPPVFSGCPQNPM